ncbi:MAG: GNAT family N-acetyltransferase [Planctomycetota bacterium]|jgi:ribosomal protein S18 acetylase RimI-like enzyme
MATVSIREAGRSDLPAILAIYAEPEIDDGNVLDLKSAESMLDRMKLYPDYTLYVAMIANQAVVSFTLLIMDNLAHMGAPSAVVEDVVVRLRWRGQGIGSRMIRFAMERAMQAKCYKLALSCSINRERAHKFYDSLGFEKHGYSFLITL